MEQQTMTRTPQKQNVQLST